MQEKLFSVVFIILFMTVLRGKRLFFISLLDVIFSK